MVGEKVEKILEEISILKDEAIYSLECVLKKMKNQIDQNQKNLSVKSAKI